jgi:hypothetical protein
VNYSAVPPAVEDAGDELSLSAIYDAVIECIVLSRCYSKSTNTQDIARANAYVQMGMELLTGRKRAKAEVHPEQTAERVKR